LGGYKFPFGDTIALALVHKAGINEMVAQNLSQILELTAFFAKTLALYYVVIWVRWTLPRLRVDQLMTLCWKYLTPIALFNLIGCAVWMYVFDGKPIYSLIFESAATAVAHH
jgi:NADH-quinone oxidoreductase subunit H